MSSRLIALLTDFGSRDPFVAVMKGVMLGINPDLQFIDISHEIAPQRIREAAVVLSVAFPYFPPQTIFLVVVDPGVGGGRRPIVVETAEHLFVAPDNETGKAFWRSLGFELRTDLEDMSIETRRRR